MQVFQKICENSSKTYIKTATPYVIKTQRVIDMENKPEKKFRAGTVTATIWKNQTKEGKAYSSVSFEKGYKDAEGTWKSTNKLSVSDLPRAMVVIGKAYEHLALKDEA